MIRAAGTTDAAQVAAFLLQHVDGAMFPLSNLRNHGLADGDFASAHSHAMKVWMIGPGVGGIVGYTRQGMLMPMLPDGGDLSGLRAVLAGCDIRGAVGPAPQVRALLAALSLAGRPTVVNSDEPGFALDLAALHIPTVPGARIIAPALQHRTLMIGWRTTYQIAALGNQPGPAEVQAAVDVDGYLARDSHRLLFVDDTPVAMTGFNATLPEIVQIGGVFTPPALRNRGYARLAVALHLAEARAAGVVRAVLFAASTAAARAYVAIGFQPADPVALVLFDGLQNISVPA